MTRVRNIEMMRNAISCTLYLAQYSTSLNVSLYLCSLLLTMNEQWEPIILVIENILLQLGFRNKMDFHDKLANSR